MGIEIIAGLIASILGGLMPLIRNIVKKYLESSLENGKDGKFEKTLSKIFDVEITDSKSYSQRLNDTLTTMRNASDEVNKAIAEFTELIQEKEKNVKLIEDRLSELNTEEENAKQRLNALKQIPIDAVPHLEEIVNRGNKSSAARDYILFVSGIIVSVIVTLILKFYFGI